MKTSFRDDAFFPTLFFRTASASSLASRRTQHTHSLLLFLLLQTANLSSSLQAAIAARAVVLKAAADVLLEPQSRLAHERGLLPLSAAIPERGSSTGNINNLVVGALMLSREAASRAPNAATGARASADVAARGEALLSAVSGASRGMLSGRSGAAAARDISLATALAHCEAAAAALAADAGRRSGAAAAARLARAVELLDEHHGGSRETAALREEVARALAELATGGNWSSASSPSATAAAAVGPAAAAAAAAAAPRASGAVVADSLSLPLASAADVLASSFSASDRRVALDALSRAVAPPSLSSPVPPSGGSRGEGETRAALMAAWPHLTAEEQVELLDAAELGTKEKKKKKQENSADNSKSPVPAAAAAAALVAAAVSRGSPSLVARAARLLDAEAAAAAAPPSSAARAARVAAALMLGDVPAAEAAVGVSPARQLQRSDGGSSSCCSVPDPRLVAYVSSFDPQDPLPGLCALAEAWVREAAVGGCRPSSPPLSLSLSPSSASSSSSSSSDFSLALWASSPAVALRLAAGEQASAARAAAVAAGRVASRVGGAAVAGAASFARGLVSSVLPSRPKVRGSDFEGEEEEEREGRDDEVDAAYRARFYGDDEEAEQEAVTAGAEGEEESTAVAPVARARRRLASPPSPSPSSASLPPPLPIEAAKAKTVGELAAAYARATDAAAWRSSPLPPDAVRPLEGEGDLWLNTEAARGGRGSLSLLRGAAPPSSLARTVAGAAVLVGAALAVSRVAGPALSRRGGGGGAAAPDAAAAAVGSSAAADASPPLSAKEAKGLLSSFQSAKAQACGRSSSSFSDAAAAAALERVLSGKLLGEWKGRQRDLGGWTLSYKTKRLRVAEVAPLASSPPFGGSSRFISRFSSPPDENRAVFLARVEEKVTLRDEEGDVVDESDASYDARFVAERQTKGGGEWKLSECVVS